MKQALALLLALAMTAGLTACGGAGGEPEEAPQTRTVTDVWNREVEIPMEVDSIVCLGSMAPRFAAYLDVVDMMVGAENSDIERMTARYDYSPVYHDQLKALCLGSMAPRFAAYLDVVDMMVGAENSDIERMTARYDYSPVYHDQLKALPPVGAGGGSGENNGYAEQIIQVQPDVILAGFDEDAARELESQTGIPVVCVRYRTQSFIDEGFYRAMRVFAQVVGAEERCEEVLSYVDDCKADLDRRTREIPEGEKLKAYTGAVTFNGRHGFPFTYVNFPPFLAVHARNVADSYLREIPEGEKLKAYTGAVTFNGRHGFPFTYVNFPPFLAVHARNVADSYLEEVTGAAADAAAESGKAYLGQNGFEVDLEQIFQWDPDIVFLDPGNLDLVNEEYRSNPGFFQALRAVREGEVYTMPSTNAAGPNISYILVNAYYAGSVLYPQQFADLDFEEKAIMPAACCIPSSSRIWILRKRPGRSWNSCWARTPLSR